MKHKDVPGTLIRSTISVIANEGLDKTTTKAIVRGTGINEAYIYRFFYDKEDLLAKAFAVLDEELVAKVMEHVEIMWEKELDYDLRCRLFFDEVWKFLMENKEHCLAYVRYYYSPYFQKNSAWEHKKRFLPAVAKFNVAFRDEADTWMILNHIQNVMFDFAVKVFDGELPNDEDNVKHVFLVIYNSVRYYFRREEVRAR